MSAAEQYLLPFEDMPECEAVRAEKGERKSEAGVWFERFVVAYVESDGNGTQAVHSADEAVGAKRRSDGAAAKCASKYVSRPVVVAAIRAKRDRAAREAGIELTEIHRGWRLSMRAGFGLIPLKKTLTAAYKGDITTSTEEVYEPNLPAANKALEMMAKSRGMLTDKVEHGGTEGALAALAAMIQPSRGLPSAPDDDG